MAKKSKLVGNPVNHPAHYTKHPSGVEAIEICGRMGFNLGNAFKYVFRFENKWSPLEDLKKARWYINREYFQGTGKVLGNVRKANLLWTASLEEDIEFIKRYGDKNIKKVVGDCSTDVERTLLSLWIANNEADCDDLVKARYYLDKVIRKRQRDVRK